VTRGFSAKIEFLVFFHYEM